MQMVGDKKLKVGQTNAVLQRIQSKKVEVTAEALQRAGDPSLPPLMNPTILEASDDLTNLSHLNEPAGKPLRRTRLRFFMLQTPTVPI